MKFKICLIGCGYHARLAHGPSLRKYASQEPEVELDGACDLHLPTARAFAADFGFANAYTDWQAMLEHEKPHAVSIVLPTHLTARVCLPLLERRLPLLIEKPPAMTSAELDLLSAAAKRHQVPTLVAFNRRHTTLMQQAHEILQRNMRPENVFQIGYDMIRHGRREADFSTTAIHAIDAMLYLARSPLRQAHFRYREFAAGGSEVTNVVMDAVCESGTDLRLNVQPIAGIVLERASIHAHEQSLLLEIAMRGDYQEGSLRYWRGDKLEFESVTDRRAREPSFEQNGFFAENKAFYDAVRHGGQLEIQVQDCGPQIFLMEAIRNRASSVILDRSVLDAPATA